MCTLTLISKASNSTLFKGTHTIGLFLLNLLNEPSASVRFCLSYDPLKSDFISYKMNSISIKKMHY